MNNVLKPNHQPKKASFFSVGLLKNLTLQLAVVILGSVFFGQYIPVVYKSFFLAISQSLKEGLLFFLPIIIFVCLFSSLISNQGRALRFVGCLLITVFFSNFISIIASYGIAKVGLSFVSLAPDPNAAALPELAPLWTFTLSRVM